MRRCAEYIARFLGDHRANPAVEFAMVAPVMIFVAVATIDYALYVNDNMRLSRAVASAVQFAMYNSDNTSGIQNVAYQSANYTSSDATVTVTNTCECPSGGVIDCTTGSCPTDTHKLIFVQVAMAHTYDTIFPYPGIPSSFPVSRSAQIQVP